jgi:hypothetical protein
MIDKVVMGEQLFDELISVIRRRIPNFKIKYKNRSIWQKIIGKLCFFNRKYMIDYTSTYGSTVWYPSKEFVEKSYKRAFKILAHEYVHLLDNKKHPIVFKMLYATPQIFALLSLFSILALFFSNWFLLFLVALLFALPIPSIGRAQIEIRGYAMNIAINMWRYGSVTAETINSIADEFAGWSYYRMWDRKDVMKWIDEYIVLIRNIDSIKRDDETILEASDAYADVYELLTGIEKE